MHFVIGELGDRTTVTTAQSNLRIHAIVSLACDFVPRSVSNDAIGSVRHLTIYISGCQLVIRQVDRAITRMIASCANPLSLRSREDTIRGPQKTRFPTDFGEVTENGEMHQNGGVAPGPQIGRLPGPIPALGYAGEPWDPVLEHGEPCFDDTYEKRLFLVVFAVLTMVIGSPTGFMKRFMLSKTYKPSLFLSGGA